MASFSTLDCLATAGFVKLMEDVLDSVIEQKEVSEDSISQAIRNIIESFKTFEFDKIDLSKWENSCAFLFRYGVHGADLTRCKVKKALQNCPNLSEKLEKESSLNIFSFGGGPGNDVIGLCSLLYELKASGRNLNITVTDLCPQWSFYVDTLNNFIENGNYGNVSELFRTNTTSLSFHEAPQIGRSGSEEYSNSLKNADVILVVKVLTFYKTREIASIVKSIYEGMKNGAFVLYIDAVFHNDLWNEFECLYRDPYLGDENNKFITEITSSRFGYHNGVASKAGIVVLRK